MLILEAKIYAKQAQYDAMEEAIRTAQFIRNKALRYWMDNKGVGKYQLSAYTKVLAESFSFAHKLNSMARQSSADRARSLVYLASIKTVRKIFLARRVFPNLRNTLVQLNIKLQAGSYLKTERK